MKARSAHYVAALVAAALLARQSVTSNEVGKDWTTVKRGASVAPLEFTKEGVILFQEAQCKLEVTKEDETTTEMEFSPISPDSVYRIVIGDVYDFQPAYLIDVKRCGVMHLPLPRYFQPWISWSPDNRHALFFTNYEASPQLWILDLETDQIFEVHRNGLALRADSCCGLNEWAPESGVAYLTPGSVRWPDAVNFTFKLEIFCNPYSEASGWPCEAGDIDHPRARFEVSVYLAPPKVTTGPRINLPVRHSTRKN